MMKTYIDANNFQFLDAVQGCGSVTGVELTPHNVSLTVDLNIAGDEDFTLLALDKFKRVLSARPAVKPGTTTFDISKSRFGNLPAANPLMLYVYDEANNAAYPINIPAEHTTILEKLLKAEFPDQQVKELPSFTEKYIDMIINATKHAYVSVSNTANIRTGNNYQTLDLGKVLRKGGRTSRNNFLNGVDFKGKKVLDIGANTGEASRNVRALGADLVDGYEYDGFFVETGRMINAVKNMTRVSLFQGDATNPLFYKDKNYDMVLTLAVYVYIKDVMKELAQVTDVLVYETHTLDHGLDMYFDNICPHFPFYQLIGFSNENSDLKKNRAFLVFAKTKKALTEVLKIETLKTDGYFSNRFFEHHKPTNISEFPTYLNALDTEEMRQKIKKNSELKFGSEEYFSAYLLGYKEYLENGNVVDPKNIYLTKFKKSIDGGAIDLNLKRFLKKDDHLIQKVTAKYQDIDNLLAGNTKDVCPIVLTREFEGNLKFETTQGKKYQALNIDGHHRYFLYQLLSMDSIPCILVPINQDKSMKTIERNYHL